MLKKNVLTKGQALQKYKFAYVYTNSIWQQDLSDMSAEFEKYIIFPVHVHNTQKTTYPSASTQRYIARQKELTEWQL